MNRKLLALYGLKFNPFAPELPTEALWIAPEVDPGPQCCDHVVGVR